MNITPVPIQVPMPFSKLQAVLWSDDMKIFDHAHQLWVCCRKTETYAEKYLIPTVKYGGGSLMLWGYFASTGPGALVKVNGIVNFTKYQDIFAQNPVASARRLTLGQKWIFQQDNPKHKSTSAKNKC